MQHIHGNLAEEVVLCLLTVLFVVLLTRAVQQPDADYKVVGVVIRGNYLKLLATLVVGLTDFGRNLRQTHLLAVKRCIIKDQPQYPWRHVLAGRLVLDLIMGADKILILRDACHLRVGLVVNFRMLYQQLQVEVLNLVGDCFTFVLGLKVAFLQINEDTRRLDVLGNINQLLHARDTLGAFLSRNTCT